MNTYFTSDWHFFHENIIGYTGRPFQNSNEMNETIINNINAVVNENDVLYCLGDVAFSKDKQAVKNLIARIKCKNLILLHGNHDNDVNYMVSLGFKCCMRECKLVIAKEMVTISHYPFKYSWWKNCWDFIRGKYKKDKDRYRDRRPLNYGQYLIAGHSHDKTKFKDKSINVCVEAWDYKPVPLQAITDYIIRHKKGEFK